MARISTAEKKAIELLRKARIEKAPVPVEDLVALLNAELHFEPFSGELSGIFQRNSDGTALIGVNSLDAPTRRRFTIAHEIGHLLLHNRELFHIDERFPVSLLRDDNSSLGTDRREIEANKFAAELLMPRHLLRRDIGRLPARIEVERAIEVLAKKYRVSSQAMSIRLSSLGFIS